MVSLTNHPFFYRAAAFVFMGAGLIGAQGGESTTPVKRIAMALADFDVEMEAILAAHRDDIKKHRTTWITVRAAPGAGVSVRQTRHAFEFGTAISRHAFTSSKRIGKADREQYKKVLKANFNSVVHENAMKWSSNEKDRDSLTYADADAMLAWSEKNGLSTRGHCVYWAYDKHVQPWLKELDNAALRAKLQQRARLHMQRFQGRVTEHDINNEMLHGQYYEKRLGAGIREQMFDWCHAYDPRAILYVNDYNILAGDDTGRYATQINGFLKAGMKVGGIGIQGHFHEHVEATCIKSKLDLLAQFGLPIKITEYDANTADPQAKARMLVTLYATAFAHPAVEAIYMWGFWKKLHWRPQSALWQADWSTTLAARYYRELVFKRWWTDFDGQADARGNCRIRVFFGGHDVTVNGRTRHFKVGKAAVNTIIDCTAAEPGEWKY